MSANLTPQTQDTPPPETAPAPEPASDTNLSLSDLGKRVKQKVHDYDDYDDAEVGARMAAKYPEYQARLKGFDVTGSQKLKGTNWQTIKHYQNVYDELSDAGIKPIVRSGFRTAAQQNMLHKSGYPTKGNDGYNKISPHQEGRALDIGFVPAQKDAGRKILADYAKKNGLTVPGDEPWHIAVPKEADETPNRAQAGETAPAPTSTPSQTTPSTSRKPQDSGLTSNDAAWHFGSDASEFAEIAKNPKALRVLKQAVAEDQRKRAAGQKDFAQDPDYQAKMRQKAGLAPSMSQDMRNLTATGHQPAAQPFANTRFPQMGAPRGAQHVRSPLAAPISQGIQQLGQAAGNAIGTVTNSPGLGAVAPTVVQSGLEGAVASAGGIPEKFANASDLINRFTPVSAAMRAISPAVKQRQDEAVGLERGLNRGAEQGAEESAALHPASGRGQEFVQGVARAVGSAAVEVPQLIAGSGLGALNLPMQGALSREEEGLPGIIKGAAGGLLYHYGMGATGKYLGKLGNALVWTLAPTAAGAVRGEGMKELAANLPMGVLAGMGEKPELSDPEAESDAIRARMVPRNVPPDPKLTERAASMQRDIDAMNAQKRLRQMSDQDRHDIDEKITDLKSNIQHFNTMIAQDQTARSLSETEPVQVVTENGQTRPATVDDAKAIADKTLQVVPPKPPSQGALAAQRISDIANTLKEPQGERPIRVVKGQNAIPDTSAPVADSNAAVPVDSAQTPEQAVGRETSPVNPQLQSANIAAQGGPNELELGTARVGNTDRSGSGNDDVSNKEPWQVTQSQFLRSINPEGTRIESGERPPIYAGDMEGMFEGGKTLKISSLADGRGLKIKRSPDGAIYAEVDGETVGFATPISDNELDVNVDPEYQKQGIGSKLQQEFRRENPGFQSGGLTEAGERSAKASHRLFVKEALESGKPVPSEVLADYPDLASKSTPAIPNQRQTKGTGPGGIDRRGTRIATPEEQALGQALVEQGDRRVAAEREGGIDGLTRLQNQKSWLRARARIEAPDSGKVIIAADSRNFKVHNLPEGGGLETGNVELKRIAATLNKAVEGVPGAQVFRSGGDEFRVEVPAEHAEEVAARIRELNPDGMKGDVQTGLSVGVGKTDIEAERAQDAHKATQGESLRDFKSKPEQKGEPAQPDNQIEQSASVTGRAAPPSEVSPKTTKEGDEAMTGTKVAVTRMEREQRGRDPIEKQAYTALGDAYDQGRSAVDDGEVDPRRLAAEVANKPRPLTAKEVGVLGYDRARLIKRSDALVAEIEQHQKSSDPTSNKARALAQAEFDEIQTHLDNNDAALEKGGREQSAAFNARKMLIRHDYSVTEGIRRAKAWTESGEIPEWREKQIKQAAEDVRVRREALEKAEAEHAERTKALDERQAKMDEADALKEGDRLLAEGRRKRAGNRKQNRFTKHGQEPGVSISSAIMKRGGIAPDEVEYGEWANHKQILHKSAKDGPSVSSERGNNSEWHTALAMAEEGYGVGDWNFPDPSGESASPDIDIDRFRQAVQDDLDGTRKSYRAEDVNKIEWDKKYKDYLKTEQAKADRAGVESLLEDNHTGSLYEKITAGKATKDEIDEFKRAAAEAGVSDEGLYKLVEGARPGGLSPDAKVPPATRARAEAFRERVEGERAERSAARDVRSGERGERKTRIQSERTSILTALKAEIDRVSRGRAGGQPSLLGRLDPEGKITKLIGQLAKNYVSEGITDIGDLVDKVHGHLQDMAENIGIKARDVAEAISDYGKTRFPSKDPVDIAMRRVKSLIRDKLAIEDIEASKMPLRSGFQPGKTDAEIRDSKQRVREALKKSGLAVEPAKDPEAEYKSYIDAARTRLTNQIEDINYQLEHGKRESPARTPRTSTPELDSLIAERDRVKKLLDDPTQERKDALRQRITELQKQIDSGQASTRQRTPLEIDAEEKGLREQRADLQKQIGQIRNQGKMEANLREKIDALDKRIAARDTAKTASQSREQRRLTDEQAALKAEHDLLTKQLANMRKAEAPPVDTESAQRDSLRRQISDLDRRISEGDISQRTKGAGSTNPENQALKAERDLLAKRLTDMRKAAKPEKTVDLAAKNAADQGRIRGQIADLQKRISTNDLELKKRTQTPTDARTDALKAERDLLNKNLAKFRKDAKDKLKPPPEEQATAILKARLERKLSQTNLASSVFGQTGRNLQAETREAAKAKRDVKPPDPPEVAALREKVTAAQARFDRLTAKPTGTLDALSALRKVGLISGIRSVGKHVGSVFGTQVFQEASRLPASLFDLGVGMATGNRTTTGVDVPALARSSFTAATKGLREAREVLKHGGTVEDLNKLQLGREVNTNSPILNAYINYQFRFRQAIDRPFHIFALTRSIEDQAKTIALNEKNAGKITDVKARAKELRQNPTTDMQTQAALDAEVATFKNANPISSTISAARRSSPVAHYALDAVLPFDKTPTNVVLRAIEATPVGGVYTVGRAAVRAVIDKGLTPAEQRIFSQRMGRATAGTALVYLGAKLFQAGVMKGDDEQKKEPIQQKIEGPQPYSMKIGNRWYQLNPTVSPIGALLGLGASIARDTPKKGKTGGAENASMHGLLDIAKEQPALQQIKDMGGAISGKTDIKTNIARAGGAFAGSFVPTIVSDTGQAMDRDVRGVDFRAPAMKQAEQEVEKRVPFARRNLPKIASQRFYTPFDPLNSRPANRFVSP